MKATATNGVAAGSAEHVEVRRFRTWDNDSEPAQAAWKIVLRYQVLRVVRTWWMATLLVVLLVYLVSTVGSAIGGMADHSAPSADDAVGLAFVLLLPAMTVALLLGTPQFADDIRFNAPLFYFSRPLRREHYFAGKTGFLALGMALVGFVPMLLVSVLMLILVPALAEPPEYLLASDLPDWRATHVDTFADAMRTVISVLPATIILLAFLTALTLVMSAYTKRAWHAGLGVIGILGATSALGGAASDLASGTVYGELLGPAGWANLVLQVPLDVAFAGEHGYHEGTAYYDQWFGAVLLAYVLLTATTYLMLRLAWDKVRTQGESA